MKEIGGYEILGMIGEGGMGTVYRARDPRFDRVVAVKVLFPQLVRNAEVAERFRSEAVIQAKLTHPHIVTVYDFVAEDDSLAIVMELVDGSSLDEAIEAAAGPLPLPWVVDVMNQVLAAMSHAHSQGLVHRDLKPSNVLVQEVAGRPYAKVMDFGIAKILGAEKLRTATTAKMGTLAYMSPEHVQSPRNVDRRSDVYSLGVILYEMLSGRLPFDAETEYGLMRQIVEKPPRQLPPSVRERALGLAAVVARALAKRREDRYQRCDELLEALEAARSGGGAAAPRPATGPAAEGAAAPSAPPTGPSRGDEGRLGRLSPWTLGAGAVLALLAVLGLGMHLVSASGGLGSGEAEREIGRKRASAPGPEPVEETASAESAEEPEVFAVAQLAGQGAITGAVAFVESGGEVEISARISNVPEAGAHGLHVHEIGECHPPDFTGSGRHFNPGGSMHGGPEDSYHHAGDLGNVWINDQGFGELHLTSDMLTVVDGPHSVIGKAVILHAGEDDLLTQPSGDAGARIACGVIEPAERTAEILSMAGIRQ